MTERQFLTQHSKLVQDIIKNCCVKGAYVEAKITDTEKFSFSKLSFGQRKELFNNDMLVYKMTDMSMGRKPADYFCASDKYLLVIYYMARNSKLVLLKTSDIEFQLGTYTFEELLSFFNCVWHT